MQQLLLLAQKYGNLEHILIKHIHFSTIEE